MAKSSTRLVRIVAGSVPDNRLHLALAHGVGHKLTTFGKTALCDGGPPSLS